MGMNYPVKWVQFSTQQPTVYSLLLRNKADFEQQMRFLWKLGESTIRLRFDLLTQKHPRTRHIKNSRWTNSSYDEDYPNLKQFYLIGAPFVKTLLLLVLTGRSAKEPSVGPWIAGLDLDLGSLLGRLWLVTSLFCAGLNSLVGGGGEVCHKGSGSFCSTCSTHVADQRKNEGSKCW